MSNDVRDRATEALKDIEANHAHGSREHAELLAAEVKRLRGLYEPDGMVAPVPVFNGSNGDYRKSIAFALEERAAQQVRDTLSPDAWLPASLVRAELEARLTMVRRILDRAGWELRQELAREARDGVTSTKFNWTPDSVQRLLDESKA